MMNASTTALFIIHAIDPDNDRDEELFLCVYEIYWCPSDGAVGAHVVYK
jgi:hypothetical protein